MAGELGDAALPRCEAFVRFVPAFDLAACADALERKDNYFISAALSAAYARYAQPIRIASGNSLFWA